MLRLLCILLSAGIMLVPTYGSAEEKVSPKKQVKTLYKNYRASLTEGHNDQAQSFAEQMYRLTPKAYGKKSKTHATATFNLAQMNELTQDYKGSAKLYQEHLDILDSLGRPKDERYLSKLGLLTDVYAKADQGRSAVSCAKRALNLAKELNVSEDILADYELSMGINYYTHSPGKYNTANAHFNTAYGLRAKLLGADHLSTAEVILWQTNYHYFKKDYDQVLEKYHHLLDIYQKNLSPDDDLIKSLYFGFQRIYKALDDEDNVAKYSDLLRAEFQTKGIYDYMPIVRATPIYPRRAAEQGLGGYVIVEYTVDREGKVKDAIVIESTNKIFNRAAVSAVNKFEYKPTLEDGVAVEVTEVRHKITFEMER